MTGRAAKTPRRVSGKQAPAEAEPVSQFTLKMWESLHRELARRALDSGMTMRGFVMSALKRASLPVTDADLVDQRRRR